MVAIYNPNFVRHGSGNLFLVPYVKNPAQSVGGITVTTPGTGYTSAPTVTFTGGGSSVIRPAQGYAVLSGATVSQVVITDPGDGYATAPTITFTGGAGTGAAATATLGSISGPLVYTAPPAAPTALDIVNGYFQRFYVDPVQRRVLHAAAKPWAMLDATGLKGKPKQDMVQFDPITGPKMNVGISGFDAPYEAVIGDPDPAHLADALSASAAELLSVAAATGKAGRQLLLMGPQRLPQRYTALWRMPSITVPGEFDHWLIPRATLVVEADHNLSPKDPQVFKVRFSPEADPFLLSPANGEMVVMVADIANAPAA